MEHIIYRAQVELCHDDGLSVMQLHCPASVLNLASLLAMGYEVPALVKPDHMVTVTRALTTHRAISSYIRIRSICQRTDITRNEKDSLLADELFDNSNI
jgi:hypothetical protein